MSNIRARIAEALLDCHMKAAPPITIDVYEIADAVLSLPGIAIVELPERWDETSQATQIALGGEIESVYFRFDEGEPFVIVSGLDHFTVDEARALAAALLATANAADQQADALERSAG